MRYLKRIVVALLLAAVLLLAACADPAAPVPAGPENNEGAVPSTVSATEPETDAASLVIPEVSTEDTNLPETEPATEPVTEPVTEPETDPVTEPVTEPVTDPGIGPFDPGLNGQIRLMLEGSINYTKALQSDGSSGLLSREIYAGVRRAEAQSGTAVELCYAASGRNVIGTVRVESIAGDLSADIAVCGLPVEQLCIDGLFRDLKKQPGIDTGAPYWSAGINSNLEINGRLYGIAGEADPSVLGYSRVIFFNEALATSYGIDPGAVYSQVRAGGFTMSRLIELCRDVYSGSDWPTLDDTYGLGIDTTNVQAYYTSFAIDVIGNADGKLELVYSSIRSEALSEMISAVNRGKGVAVNLPVSKARSKFAGGTLCMLMAHSGYALENDLSSLGGKYGVIPYPKLDDSQAQYATYTASYAVFAIPVAVTDDRAALAASVLGIMAADSHSVTRPAFVSAVLPAGAGADRAEIFEGILDRLSTGRHVLYGGIGSSSNFYSDAAMKNYVPNSDSTFRDLILSVYNKSIGKSLEQFNASLY
jgi:hypothetical protein